jgi:hypothetical protein
MTTVLLRPDERATFTPLGWLDISCRCGETGSLNRRARPPCHPRKQRKIALSRQKVLLALVKKLNFKGLQKKFVT